MKRQIKPQASESAARVTAAQMLRGRGEKARALDSCTGHSDSAAFQLSDLGEVFCPPRAAFPLLTRSLEEIK